LCLASQPHQQLPAVAALLLRPAGYEKLLRVFEVERPDAAPTEMQGATGVIRNMLYVGPSKSQLVSSTSDVPGLLVWDMRSGKMERTLQTDGAVGSMDVSGCQLVLFLCFKGWWVRCPLG
jgi:hypothetical protein